ncbi:hypothetical protein SF83666_b65070 (plasmid) [Sinorhizobium fredii CCBAU 83666]|nr:hypothetical protein SF83666_b65070 [Sinorhizobium fredii CCBAU 83666]
MAPGPKYRFRGYAVIVLRRHHEWHSSADTVEKLAIAGAWDA